MHHPDPIAFAQSFVDACTLRPFFRDLKQLKELRLAYGEMPSQEISAPVTTPVAVPLVARAA